VDDAVLRANGFIQKGMPTTNIQTESPRLDISSIKAKVGKLVKAKIAELLGA
jgi:hypothetical protein